MDIVEEFKASQNVQNIKVILSESDAKMEKIAMSFLRSFEKFQADASAFFCHQMEVSNSLMQINQMLLRDKFQCNECKLGFI